MQQDSQPALVPVILCGGPGSRLWPLSRQLVPKPFIELPQGGSLLGALLNELPFTAPAEVVYVAAKDHIAACLAAHAQARISCPPAVVAEPAARNTAPAVAMAARYVAVRHGPAAVLAVLPADHWIADRKVFNAALVQAAEIAHTGKLVVLGVEPRSPATGYGYIEAKPGAAAALEVARFIEKPAAEVAQQLLAAGNHYWNAGIFVGTAAAFTQEFEQHAPALAAAAAAWEPAATEVQELPEQQYAQLEAVAIDVAIAEKSSRLAMVPLANSGWSDVGTWEEFRQLLPAADDTNRVAGEAQLVDSHNVSVIANGERLVAVVDCEDINVVDTPDVLLVSKIESSAGMRKLQQQLGDDSRLIYPSVEQRPWGRYIQLGTGAGWKAKRIEVNPGCRVSLQSHKQRAENWVIVIGEMTVTIDNESKKLTAGESCFIPQGARHRMANETNAPAVLVEVQSGSYLGEDDIVRYADDFGRS